MRETRNTPPGLVSSNRPHPIQPSHFSMTRSTIIAILAFSLLMIVNITVFGVMSFRVLSEKMVTERLMEGVNEAQRLINQQVAGDNLSLSRELAPRLTRYAFRAVLVIDRNGQIIHREEIRAQGVLAQKQPRQPNNQPSDRKPLLLIPKENQSPGYMTQAQFPVNDKSPQTSLALEYNEDAIRQEVDALRGELNFQLRIAVVLSLALLGAGLAYVIWSYKKNKTLEEEARKADRLAYVGTLASGLAHEIRNPLNSMNMNVQLIQEELDEMGMDNDDEVQDMLEGTRKEIRRLEKMVSSFLAYARPTKVQLTPNHVNDLVRDTLQFLGPEIEKCGVKVSTNLDETLTEIPLDEGQIKQALINVIQNGVQVLKPGEALDISTRKAGGDKILITIRDEGPGIAPEELKNIFKVFYSTKRGGTGLGLATSQRIAELHHGGIKVESEVGRGSSFTFILPMEAPSV